MSKFCNLQNFPHFTFHFTKNYEKVFPNQNFQFHHTESVHEFSDVVEMEKSSDSNVRDNLTFFNNVLEESKGLTRDDFVERTYYYYVFDYTVNTFCSHQLNHIFNPKVRDCKYDDECQFDHANEEVLSSIIGYITYIIGKKEIIAGYVHCLHHPDGYDILYLNFLSEFYEQFEANSLEYCLIERFDSDVMPILLPKITSKVNDPDLVILRLNDIFVGEEDILLSLLYKEY